MVWTNNYCSYSVHQGSCGWAKLKGTMAAPFRQEYEAALTSPTFPSYRLQSICNQSQHADGEIK